MKRLLVIALAGIAVALGTAGTAQAGDRHCYSSRSSHYGHSHGYSRSYSSGYCAPRTYYRSYNYCPPTTYYRSYNSYNCQPRYYSNPCYRSGGISISVPGFGFYYRR